MIGILAESFMTATRAEIWRLDRPGPAPDRAPAVPLWRGWWRSVR